MGNKKIKILLGVVVLIILVGTVVLGKYATQNSDELSTQGTTKVVSRYKKALPFNKNLWNYPTVGDNGEKPKTEEEKKPIDDTKTGSGTTYPYSGSGSYGGGNNGGYGSDSGSGNYTGSGVNTSSW